MKKIKNISKNNNLIIVILLIVVLTGMTLGFAGYNRILNISGGIIVKPDGKFEIKSILRSDSSNFDITNSENPVVIDNVVSFDLVYKKDNTESMDYYVEYDVSVENNSSYDYLFNAFNFEPVITGLSGGTGEIELTLDGLNNGDIIPAKSTLNFKVRLTLIPSDPDDIYEVTGDTEMDAESELRGSILIGIKNSPIDLTGDNRIMPIVFEVASTYSATINFLPKINNSSFILTDENGNPLTSMTINGNSTREYTVYLSKNGDPHFYSDNVTLKLSLQTDLGNFLSNDFKTLVDIYTEPDEEAPVVNSIAIADSSSEGTIDATFSGSDNSNGDITYTVKLYNSSTNRQVGNAVTVTSSSTDEQTVSFTGIEQGTNTVSYYATVSAKDTSGNTSSEKKSANVSIRWRVNVDLSGLTNVTASPDSTTALLNKKLEITLSVSYGYTVNDNSVNVTMGGVNIITNGTASTGASYTKSTDKITINNVTGDIKISASRSNGTCLIEGTKVLLANGKYKNIEDINYDDLIASWDYSRGQISYAYPVFIEVTFSEDKYQKITFSDGTVLGVVGEHAIFNLDLNRFVLTINTEEFRVGDRVAKIENGKVKAVKVKNIEYVKKHVKTYHVVTTGYFNIISNGLLTTDRNIMISNQYGFDENIKWPKGNREYVINNNDNLYPYSEFSSFMPYHIYKGLRVDEGKFVVEKGYITLDLLKMYLAMFPANPNYYIEPMKDFNGNNMWMVTTSLDDVNKFNKQTFLKTEGSYYTVPGVNNVKCFYSFIDNKCFKPGEKFQVMIGTYLEARYK